jgi:hypothetical protein
MGNGLTIPFVGTFDSDRQVALLYFPFRCPIFQRKIRLNQVRSGTMSTATRAGRPTSHGWRLNSPKPRGQL